MNDLIAFVEHDGKKRINARDLYELLGVKRDFSNWIKDRIEKYEFEEGEDYETCSPNLANQTKCGGNRNDSRSPNLASEFDSPNLANQTRRGGDRRSVDYLLSITMAKELAMVENNEQGRKIRRHLIKLEKAWNTPESVIARATQMGVLPELQEPQFRNQGEVEQGKWLCAIGVISKEDFHRFAYGSKIPASEKELEVDPIDPDYELKVNALRKVQGMNNDEFPLAIGKVETIIRGHCGTLFNTMLRETPYEGRSSLLRDEIFFVFDKYFSEYSYFNRNKGDKLVEDKFTYLKTMRKTANMSVPFAPVYVWKSMKPESFEKLKAAYSSGTQNIQKIRNFYDQAVEKKLLGVVPQKLLNN